MEEEIQEIPEEEQSHKKIILEIVGVFLILLILSLAIFSRGNSDILLGLIGSSKIDNYKTEFNNITIEFNPETYEELVEHYTEGEGNEIKVCLLGSLETNYLFINNIHYPKIISQSFKHIESEPCPLETIITLHSHPNRRCMPSEQDSNVYQAQKPNYPNLMAAIMCEKGRLYFYE